MSLNPASSSHQLPSNSTVFDDCVNDFRKGVPPGILHHFQHVTSLNDLNHAIEDIERQQAANRSFRNLGKIRPFLDILTEYAGVVDTLVNAKPDVLALIWGPIKFCLQVASKYGKAFDSLLSAYGNIRNVLPSISALDELFGSQDLVVYALQRVYTNILEFHKRAVTFFSKPGWKMILRTTCRTLDDIFGDALSVFQHSIQSLLSNANIVHYRNARDAHVRAEQALLDQQKRDLQTRKLAVQSWLGAFPHKNEHARLCSLRQKYPDTCGWLFKDQSWQTWKAGNSNSRRTFWTSGIPGAGKTVLFSAMVDEIRQSTSQAKDFCTTTYLYCKYNDSSRDNFVALTRSLINSLLEGNDLCCDYLYDLAVTSNEQIATTTDLLSDIVIDLLQFYDHVYIGIDGLDEMEPTERAMMIKLILRITNLTDDDHLSHIFMTSRAEHDIEAAFDFADRLKLEASHVTGDIRSYSARRTDELSRFQVQQHVLDDLVATVVVRSDGMFLLAKLIFDMFDFCRNKEDFNDELSDRGLPQGIGDAYHRILSRVHKRNEGTRNRGAGRLLEILTFARRTLYLHEVQTALAIDIGRGDIDFENRRYVQHFKEICGPIVEVNPDETVTLVHATAQQYLSEHDHGIFEIATAKRSMADTCVTYLSLEQCFGSGPDPAALLSAARNGCFGFYRYALCNWLHHASQAAQTISSTSDRFWSSRDILKVLKLGFPINLRQIDVLPCVDSCENDQGSSQPYLRPIFAILDKIENGDALPESDHEYLQMVVQYLDRIQSAVERLVFDDGPQLPNTFLKAAYGSNPYLCNKLGCPRFHQGFPSADERNIHQRTHSRPHTCEFPNCDFSRIGFVSKKVLETHLQHFHADDLSIRFSQLDTRSPREQIMQAVKDNDVEAIRELYLQMDPIEITGSDRRKLIFRAIRENRTEAACALVEHDRDLEGLFETPKSLSLLFEATARQENWQVMQILLSQYVHCLDYLSRRPKGVNYFNRNADQWLCRVRPDVLGGMLNHTSFQDVVRTFLSITSENLATLEVVSRHIEFDDEDLKLICLKAAQQRESSCLMTLLPKFIRTSLWTTKYPDFLRNLSDVNIQVSQYIALYHVVKGTFMIDDIHLSVINDGLDKAQMLAHVVRVGHVPAVRFLLGAGAALDHEVTTLCSALCFSSILEDSSVMKLLIEAGADVNHCSNISGPHSKSTPLHQAVRNWRTANMTCLLDNGADFTIVDSRGNTAFNTEIEDLGRVPLAYVLQDFSNSALIANIRQLIRLGARCDRMELAKKYLHHWVTAPDTRYTVLGEALKILVANGLDIDQQLSNGRILREHYTLHAPQILTSADLALSIPSIHEIKTDEAEQDTTQPVSETVQDNIKLEAATFDPERRRSSSPSFKTGDDFLQSPTLAGNVTQCPEVAVVDAPPQSLKTQTEHTSYEMDRNIEELSYNPWADSEEVDHEGSESHPSYQYTIMAEWF